MFLGLGGNVGQPAEAFQRALRSLAAAAEQIAVAPLYRSPAESQQRQPDYLNTVTRLFTRLEPEEILALAKQLEWHAGRRRSARDAPRPLDIDLLLYGDRCINRPELTVPHPRMRQRAFVLAPLADLAPDRLLPPGGPTVRAQLSRLVGFQTIRRLKPWPDWAPPSLRDERP